MQHHHRFQSHATDSAHSVGRAATRPVRRWSPIISIATAGVALIGTAALVDASTAGPADPAGTPSTSVLATSVPSTSAPPAPALAPPITDPPPAPASTTPSATPSTVSPPDRTERLGMADPIATASTAPASTAPASASAAKPPDRHERRAAGDRDTDAEKASEDEAEFVDEAPLPGVEPGVVVPGDLVPTLPVVEHIVHELHVVNVPDTIDLLVDGRSDRDHDRDREGERDDAKPAPVDDFAWGGAGDQVVIGQVAPGCLAGCVTTALISEKPTTADVGFRIETTVATRVDVALANVDTGQQLHFSNGGYDTEWTATLGPLDAGEVYAVLIEVNDQLGYEEILTHQFTAPDPVAPAWDIVGNVTGCAAQCITHGVVRTTDDPARVVVEVETSVDASVTVWVSTAPPVAGVFGPTLPDSAIVAEPSEPGTEWAFDVDGLQTDTLHHVIVRAEDDDGGVSVRAGQFVTEAEIPRVVEATFRWVFVQNDGDNGLLFGGVDAGELRFVWATQDGVIGHRSEDKIDAGTTVHLGEPNTVAALVSSDLEFPALGFSAGERDWNGLSFGQWLPGVPPAGPTAWEDMTTNVVWSFPLAVDEIEALPECGDSALGADWSDERCLSLVSADAGDDFAKFQLMVSFRFVT